jgi:hypothetical protein
VVMEDRTRTQRLQTKKQRVARLPKSTISYVRLALSRHPATRAPLHYPRGSATNSGIFRVVFAWYSA